MAPIVVAATCTRTPSAPNRDGRVGQVEGGPDAQVDIVDDAAAQRGFQRVAERAPSSSPANHPQDGYQLQRIARPAAAKNQAPQTAFRFARDPTCVNQMRDFTTCSFPNGPSGTDAGPSPRRTRSFTAWSSVGTRIKPAAMAIMAVGTTPPPICRSANTPLVRNPELHMTDTPVRVDRDRRRPAADAVFARDQLVGIQHQRECQAVAFADFVKLFGVLAAEEGHDERTSLAGLLVQGLQTVQFPEARRRPGLAEVEQSSRPRSRRSANCPPMISRTKRRGPLAGRASAAADGSAAPVRPRGVRPAPPPSRRDARPLHASRRTFAGH